MNLKQRVSLAWAGLTAKSLSGFAASFARGDDLASAQVNKLTDPYAQSAWVYSAVNHIASEVSGRPLKFYEGDNEYTDAAFADFWAAPALGTPTLGITQPRLPLADVLFDLSAWASLEGEWYICFDDSWAVAGLKKNPAALSPFLIANPRRMHRMICGGKIEGYRYTDAGGQQIHFLPDQVIAWKSFNPSDPWCGLGALEAARVAAEGAYLTGTYIRDLMRNNGDQGAIVIGKGGVIDDAQKEQIVAGLRAKRAALARGVAKDLFLTGDITVERPKEQSAGAEVIAAKGLSHQEIYVAFGVPPSMAEVKASYSLGKDSDRYQLINGTCVPRGIKIAGSLAEVARRMTGRKLTAELDWDDHPVMVEVRYSRIESGLKLWGVGMPMKQVNDYLDLGMSEYPGWDEGYLPFSVSPVSGDLPRDPAADPASAEPTATPANTTPEDPAVLQLRLALMARARAAAPKPACKAVAALDSFAVFACNHGKSGVPQKARSERELARWRDQMSKRRATLRGYESRFNRELMKARSETLANLGSTKSKGITVTKATAADMVFDLAKFTDSLFASFRRQSKLALDGSGKQLLEEIGKDDPFSFPPEEVLDYVRARENKLSDVPQAVFDRIKESLEEGITDGETTEQLADRVRADFNGISKDRARTIASTETGAAYGAGREEAMRSAGIQYKQWLTSGNDNVRAAHLEANGQTVPIDEPFEVGGEALMYPGDSDGSPENVINCHCVSIAVEKPAEQ